MHRPAPVTAPPGTRYTCPMDPEIVRDAPGDCPICGMALEPMAPSPDAGPNPELVDFRRRLWIGAPLGLATLVLEMGGHLGLPFAEWLGPKLHVWLQLLLATPVVAWVAAPFFRRRLGVRGQPAPQHVDPDRARSGRHRMHSA